MAKILVAEDTPTIQKFLRFQLNRIGHEIAVASDGAQAMASVESIRPDLIILDLMMPFMSGFEVLRELQGNKSTNSIPVIIVSAKNQPHDIDRGINQGAYAYLTKPFSISNLVARIDDALALAV